MNKNKRLFYISGLAPAYQPVEGLVDRIQINKKKYELNPRTKRVLFSYKFLF